MKKSSISHSTPEFTTTIFNMNVEPLKGLKWFENNNKQESVSVSKKLEKYVTYDEDGNFVEVELAIEIEALPASIIEYVKKNHPINTIKEASEIVAADGTVSYKTELKRIDLFFDSNGSFFKLREN